MGGVNPIRGVKGELGAAGVGAAGGVHFDGFAIFEGFDYVDVAGFEGEEGADSDDYFDGGVIFFVGHGGDLGGGGVPARSCFVVGSLVGVLVTSPTTLLRRVFVRSIY